MKLLCLLLLSSASLRAATTIEVSAKFADVAPGTEIPATAEKLDKLKGVEVLSAPVVTTTPGKTATIEVTQPAMVPGSEAVPIGLTLTVTPTLGEKTIQFTGQATDRAVHGKRSDKEVNAVEFATREMYFEGHTTSGGTVVLHSAAAATRGEKSETKSRELVVYLKFTKHVTEPAPVKKATAAKPATSKPKTTGKTTGTSKSSSSKKSGKR